MLVRWSDPKRRFSLCFACFSNTVGQSLRLGASVLVFVDVFASRLRSRQIWDPRRAQDSARHAGHHGRIRFFKRTTSEPIRALFANCAAGHKEHRNCQKRRSAADRLRSR